jgi:hypothetical protein
MTGAITSLLYFPAALTRGYGSVFANSALDSLTYRELANQLPGMVGRWAKAVTHDLPMPVAVLIGVGLALAVVATVFPRLRPGQRAPLLFMMIVLAYVGVMGVKRVLPFTRVGVFAMPSLYEAVAFGLVCSVRWVVAHPRRQAATAGMSAANQQPLSHGVEASRITS